MSFSLYSDNLVDQSVLSASTVNASFPVANIQDYRRSKVFRSTSNSSSIVFDFGETSDADTIFLIAEKRNGFGFSTVTFEFNATDSWGAPAASESVTFSTAHGVGFKEFASTHSYRFCRMVMTSTLGYCEVANLFIGKKQAIERSVNFGWSYKDDELSIKKFNRYGQMFTDVISRQKTINCAIQYMDKDNLDELMIAYDYCGETKPLFIKLGSSDMINDYRRFSGMVFFNDTPTITNSHFNKYSTSFQFKEAM